MLTLICLVLYPIILLILMPLLFKFFRIRTFSSINIPDVMTFFLIVGLHYFSRKLAHISIIPYFSLLVSVLALILLLLDLFYYRYFSAKQFIHLFWRLTFFITLILYMCMVVIVFTL